MAKRSKLGRVGAILTWFRNFVMNTLFIVIFVFLLFAVIDAFETPVVPEGGALILNPKGVMVEETVPLDPFRDFLSTDLESETDIHELVQAIDAAAEDERIRMIVLDLDDLLFASAAHAELLGAALARFGEAGKNTVAIGNLYSQSQYAIASFADAVYMNPEGSVYLPGYGAYRPYFKSLFDKLKLNVHVFRVGEYKEAVEPLTEDKMSAAAREANQALVDGLWAAYRQRALDNRAEALDEAAFDRYSGEFDALLAETGGDAARAALESGLIDELMSADQMRSHIASQVGRDNGGDFKGIGYKSYLQTLGPRLDEAPAKIGLIMARGIIQMGDDNAVAAADNLVELIREAREDMDVEALVVRVDSPGGSAFASELIRQELELVQLAGKPVVVSMGSVAASGGYWISSTADRIFAHPTTITGSIGIFSLLLTFEESLSSIGVHSDGVGSSLLSGALDPMRPLSDPMQRILQANVEHGYRKFVHLVARGRDMTPAAVEEVAEGRVWLGSRALDLGLVDALGGLSESLEAAAELAGITDYSVERFATTLSPEAELIQDLLESAQLATANPLTGVLRQAWQLAEALNDPMHTYAICETCLSLTE